MAELNSTLAPHTVSPDPAQALRFFRALFPEGSWLHFRAVPEPKDAVRKPTNHWYQMGERFAEDVEGFLAYCAAESRAAFFLPAIARPSKSHKDAVEAFTCFCFDFDRGHPPINLACAEKQFGPADLLVESGGVTAFGPKMHAYWLLPAHASTPETIQKVCRARENLAMRFGGDPCLKQEAQVLRIPGSIHFKNGPRPVRMIRCP